MSRIALFAFGLAAAMLIIFRSSDRGSQAKAPPAFADDGARPSVNRVLPSSSDAWPAPQSAAWSEPASGCAAEKTLQRMRAELRELCTLPRADKEREDEIFGRLTAMLTDDNAAAITRALSTAELHSRFGSAALERWLKVDVSAAADWVAARPDASDEQAWLVAQVMARDAAALELYCAELPDGPWRQLFLQQAAAATARRNPLAAIQLVEQFGQVSVQLDLLQTTVDTWMTYDPAAASAWVAHVPDPLLREELACIGAKTLGASDPLKAVDWMLSILPQPSAGSDLLVNETLQHIFGAWAQTAPAQAAEAVAQLPPGELRQTMVSFVSRDWLQRDPDAAAAWMGKLLERQGNWAITPPRD